MDRIYMIHYFILLILYILSQADGESSQGQ